MRSRFDEELDQLNRELLEMAALCENAISRTTKALLEGNVSLTDDVLELDEEIDHKERKIESLCLKLLLQQQPVARDLRQISSALKMITDMERIGDQAADIAEITCLANSIPEVNTMHIGEMARGTIKMVTESIDAFVNQDLEQARAIIAYDDVIDRLFDQVKLEVIDLIKKDARYGECAVDLLMIAKYFERIGDHITNIAEWVEFSITGHHEGENDR
ncbi:phosphate signaling complex protein PhoU [Anaerolentibacter hominis]|uniref:phosphate signaling complex protein PhoU n=1 Tax=Anaerolentibacter hominis TaxID=3079009 RepID=UPI0031B8567D